VSSRISGRSSPAGSRVAVLVPLLFVLVAGLVAGLGIASRSTAFTLAARQAPHDAVASASVDEQNIVATIPTIAPTTQPVSSPSASSGGGGASAGQGSASPGQGGASPGNTGTSKSAGTTKGGTTNPPGTKGNGKGGVHGPLAFTGLNAVWLISMGIGLILAGILMLRAAGPRGRRATRLLSGAVATAVTVWIVSAVAANTHHSDAQAASSPATADDWNYPATWPGGQKQPVLEATDPSGRDLSSSAVVEPGTKLLLTATGFRAGETVVATPVAGEPGQTVRADDKGVLHYRFVVGHLAPGGHTVVLKGSRLTDAYAFTIA
jgi:hypothetical protein